MKLKRIILFPIESSSREAECRIELANSIIRENKGYIVIIGEQQLIRLIAIFLQRISYFGKHIFAKPKFGDTWFYNKLKKNFSKIFYLHEEGVFPGPKESWSPIIDRAMRPSLFDDEDTLFLWSRFQYEYFQSHNLSCKVHVTGHPRFDLYKKASKENHIYKYLFNSSFSYSNNGQGQEFIFSGKNPSYKFDTMELKSEYYGRYLDQSKNQLALERAAINLALRNPNSKIKFRPHPSENLEYYRIIFSQLENIIVDNSTTINKDLKDSEVIIQIGCTTAIEGYLSGKKVYTLEGTQDSGAQISYDLSDKFIFDKNGDVKFLTSSEILSELVDYHSNLTLDNLSIEKDSTSLITSILCSESKNQKLYSKFYLFMILSVINYIGYPIYWLLKCTYYVFTRRLSEIKDFKQRYSLTRRDIHLMRSNNGSIKILSKYLFIVN